MKHIFSETEEIARKNKRNHPEHRNLNSWATPKTLGPQIIKPTKSKFKEFLRCRDCHCNLKRLASRIAGICPSCDLA